MKTDAARRESVSGWIRLGLGTFLVLVLPVWSILTASFLQASPIEEMLLAEREGTQVIVTAPGWVRFLMAAFEATLWLGVLLGILGLASFVWWLISRRQRQQGLVQYARYAEQSPVDLEVADEEWEVTIRTKSNSANNLNELGEDKKLAIQASAKTPPVR